MRRSTTVWVAATLACTVLLTCWSGVVRAQDEEHDAEGAKDHPAIPAYPGFTITGSEQHDFGAHDFPNGPDSTKRVEGKTWALHYDANEGVKQPSALEIVRNYKNAFLTKGGSVVYGDEDSGNVTFKLPQPNGDMWVELDARDNGWYTLDIVETAAMQQKVELSADAMATALATSGRIALHGILFDTGKADIKTESSPLLDEIAKLLKNDTSLRLSVEGHTDNVGAKAANLALSKKRAASVKAALAQRGVEDSRLAAEGFGDTKPVADNKTAEGRAKNRRVELVKQ